jgi:uncharacterized cupredoxin-like copper-binding protein
MRRSLTVVMVVAGALVLSACGSNSDTESNTGAAIPSEGNGGSTIAVALGETDADTMYLRLSQDSVAAGSVTFVVTNEGQKEHEFIVIQTDTPAADFPLLPKSEDADHNFDEDAVGTAIDEVEALAAGDTGEMTVTLEPGHYALVCNIRPHYEEGMWADFEVT